MGDPKKFRKKYSTPNHPWNKDAIEVNRVISREFGLMRKKEIFIADSYIKKYRKIAKNLIVDRGEQALKEREQIMKKLRNLGLLTEESKLDDVLSLELKDILERRLQTLVFKKGLARSMKQARQFITHRHIKVAGKEITSPSYFVSVDEEAQLSFKETSHLFSEDHPERVDPNKDVKEEAEALKEAKKNIAEKDVAEEKTEEVKPKSEPKVEEKVKGVSKTEEVKPKLEPKVEEKVKEVSKTEEVKPKPEPKVEEKVKEVSKTEEVKPKVEESVPKVDEKSSEVSK
ncbi:30S ribosomal protein S4 [archaeon]|nr:30S ribosomal protein S4 [archaeon]